MEREPKSGSRFHTSKVPGFGIIGVHKVPAGKGLVLVETYHLKPGSSSQTPEGNQETYYYYHLIASRLVRR